VAAGAGGGCNSSASTPAPTTAQAEQALGPAVIASITAAGGLLVAPVHDPAAGTWPWFLVSGTQDNDLRVADEVLACAMEKLGVDLRRIHSLGFSAGAIHSVQMSYGARATWPAW
jgi:hypothetical protein